MVFLIKNFYFFLIESSLAGDFKQEIMNKVLMIYKKYAETFVKL